MVGRQRTGFLPASPGSLFSEQTHLAVHDSPIDPGRHPGPPPELPASSTPGAGMECEGEVLSQVRLLGREETRAKALGRSQNLSL